MNLNINLRVSGIFAESFATLKNNPFLVILSTIPVLFTILVIKLYLPFSQRDVYMIWFFIILSILFLFQFFISLLISISLKIQENGVIEKKDGTILLKEFSLKSLLTEVSLFFISILIFLATLISILFLSTLMDVLVFLILFVILIFIFYQRILVFSSPLIIVYNVKWKEALIQGWKIYWKWFGFTILFGEGGIEYTYVSSCFIGAGIVLFFIPYIGKFLVIGLIILYLTYHSILISKFIIKARRNDYS